MSNTFHEILVAAGLNSISRFGLLLPHKAGVWFRLQAVPSALNFTRGGFHLALVRLVSSVPLDFETAPFALYQVTYSTKRRTAPQPGSPKCAFYVIRTMPAKQPHGSQFHTKMYDFSYPFKT